MKERPTRVFWAYTVLNCIALLWWLALAGLPGLVLGKIFWIGLVLGYPVGMVTIRRWGRRIVPPLPRTRTYYRLSKIFLALSWLPAAALAGILILLTEPWPLSLRQGPDTSSARELFAYEFGMRPPVSVVELYGRRKWGGLGEHMNCVAFRFTDEAVIEDIVRHRSLIAVPADEISTLQSLPGPSWWPAKETLSRMPEAYRHPSSISQWFRHLWIDRAQGKVYFQDVDGA
ncbi:MAG: hypothetical protein ACE5F1_17025 [Planctomycetota bacterium]